MKLIIPVYLSLLLFMLPGCGDKSTGNQQNAREIIELYRNLRDEGRIEEIYTLIADTCQHHITKEAFLAYYNRPDSTRQKINFHTTYIKELPVVEGYSDYKRFEAGYRTDPKDEGSAENGYWRYALIREDGTWKVIWTDKILQAASQYMQHQQYDEAIQLYKLILEINPFDALAAQGIVACYTRQNQLNRALMHADNATRLMPENERHYIILGDIYGYSDQHEKAVENYQKAIRLRPNPDVYTNLGNSYKVLEQYGKAEHAYDSALLLDSSHTQAWWMKADLYFNYRNMLDSSIYYYSKALLNPPLQDFFQKNIYYGYARAVGNKAQYQIDNKDIAKKKELYEVAIENIEYALKIEPDNEGYRALYDRINEDLLQLSTNQSSIREDSEPE